MERVAIVLSNLVVICLEILFIASCLRGQAIESPQYNVIHSESDFEIRMYKESIWMSAFLQGNTSFEDTTKDGFHRLYKYIHGDNRNSSVLPMTAPVLTSLIVSSSSSSKQYNIKYYIPANFEGATPHPFPELNLKLEKWTSHCLAVRKFSGFAKDDNVNKEVETLTKSLNKHYSTKREKVSVMVDKSSYAIAQYNASYHLSGRLNEVWMNVTGFSSGGCFPNM